MAVEHAWRDNDGQQAYIKALATLVAPPHISGKEGIPADGRVRRISIEFMHEGGAWKYVAVIFGANPDDIKRCTDETFEGREAYDQDQDVSMGGMMRHVVFNADHTLLIVRLLDGTLPVPPAETRVDRGGPTTRLSQTLEHRRDRGLTA